MSLKQTCRGREVGFISTNAFTNDYFLYKCKQLLYNNKGSDRSMWCFIVISLQYKYIFNKLSQWWRNSKDIQCSVIPPCHRHSTFTEGRGLYSMGKDRCWLPLTEGGKQQFEGNRFATELMKAIQFSAVHTQPHWCMILLVPGGVLTFPLRPATEQGSAGTNLHY